MSSPTLPERLAVALLSEIASGQYRTSARFLSRREIMAQWKVSSPTATESLRLLTRWGILTSHPRSGHHLSANFLRKALYRLNKTKFAPLAGKPVWADKALARAREEIPLQRIAVISVSDLSAKSPGRVGAEVPPTNVPLPSRMATEALFTETKSEGVMVNFYLDDGREETRARIVEQIRAEQMQGVIILRRLLASSVRPLAQPFLRAGLPVVTAFDDCEGIRMVSVNFNNIGLGYTAGRQLIEAGHRHIVVLLPREEEAPYYYRDRFHGCQLAAKELGRGAVTVIPLIISLRTKRPIRSAQKLFSKNNPGRATALLATSVNVLMSLQPSLDKAEIEIPGDLSVIMCSSTPELPPTNREMDIMHLDFEEIGRRTFRALQRLYRGEFTEKIWLVESDYLPHGTVTPPGKPRPE